MTHNATEQNFFLPYIRETENSGYHFEDRKQRKKLMWSQGQAPHSLSQVCFLKSIRVAGMGETKWVMGGLGAKWVGPPPWARLGVLRISPAGGNRFWFSILL